jgi:hypothetical protein
MAPHRQRDPCASTPCPPSLPLLLNEVRVEDREPLHLCCGAPPLESYEPTGPPAAPGWRQGDGLLDPGPVPRHRPPTKILARRSPTRGAGHSPRRT